MAKKKNLTAFQKLDMALKGNWGNETHSNKYDMSRGSDVIFKTTDKKEYDKAKLELQQNKYLGNEWVKANYSLSVDAFQNLNYIQLMFRDADLMDAFPEIGAALDTYAEESSLPSPLHGNIVNVYSKSERIKSILDDLFVNRLNIHIMAPMVIRALCKYGNQYMLLNIDNKIGVKGWRQLPVFDVERIENGVANPYTHGGATVVGNGVSNGAEDDLGTTFIWQSHEGSPKQFKDWQVAHFRLLNNSMYLPYGCSILNSARRHFRMLSLMEDMMFIYRLERSMERRVYKIFVGAIDDADVEGYVETIANRFKRTPIVDPMTGQIDLRKNILPVHKDTPIPLLDGRTIKICELAKEYEEGKENYVYSVQDKTHKIVQGKVVWCGKNYTADKLIKITLDDESHMILAPEHEIIMRDCTKKRADEVFVGESVMPLSKEMDEDMNKSLKNHEIIKIETVEGDDVYCMTVVGPNGEEDRHNFALSTWKTDKSINDSGVFVSNCIDNDIFIPTRSENAPTPIDTLAAGQNLTAMDDIKYVQNKLATALRIPKAFMNFEEAAGDGKNLALMDVRFTRIINHIQQSFLMELTKIASIHLYLLGFSDDITNFSLTMNNPSTQAEQLEIENLQKKIGACRDAISDPGNGIPVMSQTRALKEIMKWSDNDIKENLEEIRLERAIASELEKTSQIIKRTKIFDNVDRIYGESGAEYVDDAQMAQGGAGGGMTGGMGGGMGLDIGGGGGEDFGAGLDALGGPGGEENGAIAGNEGVQPTGEMGGGAPDEGAPAEGAPANESSINDKGNVLNEGTGIDALFDSYLKKISKKKNVQENIAKRVDVFDKSLLINEEFNKMIKSLDLSNDKEELKNEDNRDDNK